MILFVPKTNLFLFFCLMGISAIGGGINSLLNYGIQADNMDYIEWKFGFRAEGAVASISSFIVKAAQGVGSAIAAFALAIIKFDKDLTIQSDDTIQGLYLITFGLPCLFYIVGFFIWTLFYPLNKKTRIIMMNDLQHMHSDK